MSNPAKCTEKSLELKLPQILLPTYVVKPPTKIYLSVPIPPFWGVYKASVSRQTLPISTLHTRVLTYILVIPNKCQIYSKCFLPHLVFIFLSVSLQNKRL